MSDLTVEWMKKMLLGHPKFKYHRLPERKPANIN